MSYATNQYLPPHAQYYPTSPVNHEVHIVSPNARPDAVQRKRPKYTRSKTGCMTCRVKKIKCDETKPNCMRCSHGSRECTWPEGVPTRKKPVRKDSIDGRPSTASSSVSDPSSPQTRESSPPSRLDSELMVHAHRSPTDTFLHTPPLHLEYNDARRSERSPTYAHSPNSNMMSMMPDHSYHTSSRYDHSQLASGQHHSTSQRQPMHHHYRGMPSGPWTASPEPLDTYYGSSLQDNRTPLAHGAYHDHHTHPHSHHPRY